MPKVKISEFSSTPANNTDIDSINLAEGCAPSGINDAIRELMAQLKDFQTGAVGDSFNGPVGTTTAAAGAFTTLAASGAVTLSGGTANGVAYLNGSKVVTTGSALTFDGTNLAVTGGSVTAGSTQGNAQLIYGSVYGGIQFRNNTTAQSDVVGDTSGNLFSDFLTSAVWRNSLVGTNELMRLTSTGLGIGTSSPATRLDVAATEATIRLTSTTGTNFTDVRIVNTGGTLYSGIERSTGGVLGPTGAYEAFFLYGADRPMYIGTGNSYLRFGTNATERMRLDSAGNLGLGVTPSAWWSSAKALQIAGSTGFLGFSGVNGNIVTNTYYDGSNYRYLATAAAFLYEQSVGHKWSIASSGTAGNAITFTQAMTLDASGNLGVGTTSPSNRLDVASSTNSTIGITRTGSHNVTLNAVAGGAFTIGLDGSGGGTERARIDSSGNLLVGTTSVPSSSSGGAAFVPSSVGRTLLKLGTTTTGGAGLVEFYNPNGMIGEISVNGSTTTYSTSSDYRLKNTIAPMTGALAKVALLKPCTYKWNADGSDGQGFIAHELAEVCPDAVTGEKDAVDEDGNPKYQGIDVSFLVATLTAALQELNAKFDAYVASHP